MRAAEAKRLALEAGFDLCGICRAEPRPTGHALLAWLSAGRHANLDYMARAPERRCDPRLVWPEARSMLVVAMNGPTPTPEHGDAGATFSAYSMESDYHDTMLPRLRALPGRIGSALGCAVNGRAYVDTGPILERDAAWQAGLGWIGKSAMLISPRLGTSLMLGVLLLDIEMAPDTPMDDHCGTCQRCIDACPTQAIMAPRVVDSRRCIAYHTIESRIVIPRQVAERMGQRVFGCDICQEVCPMNRLPAQRAMRNGNTRRAQDPAPVEELLTITHETFRERFRGTPVTRAKRHGLLRNAAAALSVRTDLAAITALRSALADPEPLVREQAAQSLGQPLDGQPE